MDGARELTYEGPYKFVPTTTTEEEEDGGDVPSRAPSTRPPPVDVDLPTFVGRQSTNPTQPVPPPTIHERWESTSH